MNSGTQAGLLTIGTLPDHGAPSAIEAKNRRAALGGRFHANKFLRVIKELCCRIDLIGEPAMWEFDKLGNEGTPPWLVSWKINTLGNDGLGVDAKARRLGSAIAVDRYHKIAEL